MTVELQHEIDRRFAAALTRVFSACGLRGAPWFPVNSVVNNPTVPPHERSGVVAGLQQTPCSPQRPRTARSFLPGGGCANRTFVALRQA
jgi:hypothetical protein